MSAAIVPAGDLVADATEKISARPDCTLRIVDVEAGLEEEHTTDDGQHVLFTRPMVTDFQVNRKAVAKLSSVFNTLLTSDKWADTGKDTITIREVDTDSMRVILHAASTTRRKGKRIDPSLVITSGFPFEMFNHLLATLDQFCIPGPVLSTWERVYSSTPDLVNSAGARLAVRFLLSEPRAWSEYARELILWSEGKLELDIPEGIQDQALLIKIVDRMRELRTGLRDKLVPMMNNRFDKLDLDHEAFLKEPWGILPNNFVTARRLGKFLPRRPVFVRYGQKVDDRIDYLGTDLANLPPNNGDIVQETLHWVLPQSLLPAINGIRTVRESNPEISPGRLAQVVNELCDNLCGLFWDSWGPPFDLTRSPAFETLCRDCLKRSFDWGHDADASVWKKWKESSGDWSAGCTMSHGRLAFFDSFLGEVDVLDKLVQAKKGYGLAEAKKPYKLAEPVFLKCRDGVWLRCFPPGPNGHY